MFKKCSFLNFQTGKNVADTTFKATVDYINMDKSKGDKDSAKIFSSDIRYYQTDFSVYIHLKVTVDIST